MKQANPPWVAKLLKEVWPTLIKKVTDSSLLPKDGPTTKDYGCGHYGCVLPTSFEDGQGNEIVCKITTDTSEAQFIQAALLLSQEDEWPPGMIRYLGVYQIPNKQFRKRPIYVIWRAGAPDEVEIRNEWAGAVPGPAEEFTRKDVAIVYLAMEIAAKLRTRLGAKKGWKASSKVIAEMFRWLPETSNVEIGPLLAEAHSNRGVGVASVSDNWMAAIPKGPIGTARLYRALEACYQEMQNRASTHYIGEAMEYYQHEGIILADVHINNIRLATPEDFSDPINVISDPGHMVSLDSRWDDLPIPIL